MGFSSPLKRRQQQQQQQQSNPVATNTTSNVAATNSTFPRPLHKNRPRSRNNSKEFNPHEASTTAALFMSSQIGVGVGGIITNSDSLNMMAPQSPNGRTTQHTISNRERIPSKDYTQTYSGQHSSTNDTFSLESWRSQLIVAKNMSFLVFLLTYLTFIIILHLISASIILTATKLSTIIGRTDLQNYSTAKLSSNRSWTDHAYIMFSSSWTVTHGLHCLITLVFLHWLKGNYLFDEQGEMNWLTIWEQLEMTEESATYMRRTFCVMPLLLTYMACIISKYQPTICATNITLLLISMFPKAPFMFGVRLFGINTTPGFDDDNTNWIVHFLYRFLLEKGNQSSVQETSNSQPSTNVVNHYELDNTANRLTVPGLDGQQLRSLPYAKRG